ncbi:MAG: PhzF family phenazine biosynthesis protein [Thermotogaceae bacterium]|nr:PhzF family phenazine biosynthesis protein [Thermotogota bacterium]NLH20082.1 PhzF family phenazine biosynthesis protein [Thermotogaceae bacterium]
MDVRFWQVDSFTAQPFKGNPAGVCVTETPLPADLMQGIAAEMNLSETAFAVPLDRQGGYSLRWFTPEKEVPLCGHATLATAAILYEYFKEKGKELRFQTLSGVLKTRYREGAIEMDFPFYHPQPISLPEETLRSLALPAIRDSRYAAELRYWLFSLESEEEVRRYKPDFSHWKSLVFPCEVSGIILTAESGGEHDFVSRFFAPWLGVDEDPVTGSSHTVLGPYWQEKTGKRRLRAYQCSKRGGEMLLTVQEERVRIEGRYALVLEGVLKA